MAVVIPWHRGATAALASAITDLDARLAAVEALASGSVVAATAVTGTAAVPTHWVRDAISRAALATAVAVPAPTVRGSATRAATHLACTTTLPAVTVTVI